MKPITATLTLAALVLTLGSSGQAAAADIRVTFSGIISQTNSGPLTAGEAYSGSFIIDSSILPTGTTLVTWPGAVTQFQFSTAGQTFTGEGGFYRQFSNGFITGGFSNAGASLSGEVAGDTAPFLLQDVTWDWRTSFPANDIIISGYGRDDFSFARLTLSWSHPTATVTELGTILSLQTLDFTVVPVPAALPLLMSGLLALMGLRRLRGRQG